MHAGEHNRLAQRQGAVRELPLLYRGGAATQRKSLLSSDLCASASTR